MYIYIILFIFLYRYRYRSVSNRYITRIATSRNQLFSEKHFWLDFHGVTSAFQMIPRDRVHRQSFNPLQVTQNLCVLFAVCSSYNNNIVSDGHNDNNYNYNVI